MPTVTMPLPRMNNTRIPATVTLNLREMPALDGPGLGEIEVNGAVDTDTGEWSLWQDLEGTFLSAPAAAAWGDQQIDLFGVSTDSQLYHKRWDGTEWTLWESLEGTCIYTPAAIARGPNLVDVFVIGLDKQVYRKTWDGEAWQGWEELGGTCIHGLAATSWGADRIDLFTVGTNSCLYHNCWDGAAWQGWQPFCLKDQMAWEKSSTTIAAPAAVASAPGRIDLFLLGIDNQIYHAWGDGESWQGWENVGGPGMQGVAVAARSPQTLDLFTIGTDIEGTDNHMYHRAMVGSHWGNWDNLGGACISAPAAVALGEGRLDAFVVGTRSAMFQKGWHSGGEGGELGVQQSTNNEKAAAKQRLMNIRSRHFSAYYRTRCAELIDTPAKLDQGPFGVCGMSTPVYFLLQNDLAKFGDLIAAIFDGDAFQEIPVGMKELGGAPSDYSVLLYSTERRQLESKQKNRATNPLNPAWNPDWDFDFIVSRSLGKLLKIKNPTLYKLQTKFSEQFAPFFNYKTRNNQAEITAINYATIPEMNAAVNEFDQGKVPGDLPARIWNNRGDLLNKLGYSADFRFALSVKPVSPGNEWELNFYDEMVRPRTLLMVRTGNVLKLYLDLTKTGSPLKSDGDLAFDTYALVYLLEEVLGVRTVEADFTAYGLVNDALSKVNATWTTKEKPFVLAGINGYFDWTMAKADPLKRTFDNFPSAEPLPIGQIRPHFVHIIGITDYISQVGDYYEVPVWTWAAEYTVKIRKELLPNYIFGFVYGDL